MPLSFPWRARACAPRDPAGAASGGWPACRDEEQEAQEAPLPETHRDGVIERVIGEGERAAQGGHLQPVTSPARASVAGRS